jgi:hypothetical protein
MGLNKPANANESAISPTPLGNQVFVTFRTTPLDLKIDPVPVVYGYPVGVFPSHESR